jgi:hypothetical protein
MLRRRLRLSVLSAAAGLAVALASVSAADATTYYLKDVKFDDGTFATGSFSTGSSGFSNGYDITTVDGSIAGYHYLPTINVSYNPGDSLISFYHLTPASYQGSLNLAVAGPIDAISGDVALLASSYECSDFSCPRGTPRFVVSGFLTTLAPAAPEPATWGLMIVGFGAVGGVLRRPRRRALATR